MKKLTYEKALTELQQIVDELQEDAIGIDELSEKVGRAAELIRFCREKLRSTEADIDRLFAEKEE
jgi:exodeoxyribonuclease VII small subunit